MSVVGSGQSCANDPFLFFWPFGRQRWFSRTEQGLNFQKISPLITGRRWQPWEERHSFQQENSNIYLWFFLHTMNIQLYISEINSLTKLLCIHLTNCCTLAWRIFPEKGKRKPNYHSKGFSFVHSPAHAKKKNLGKWSGAKIICQWQENPAHPYRW